MVKGQIPIGYLTGMLSGKRTGYYWLSDKDVKWYNERSLAGIGQ